MNTEQARTVAAELQERADYMGVRTGEGLRLGQAASLIRDLCEQIDAMTPPREPPMLVDGPPLPLNATPPKRNKADGKT